MDTGKLNNCVLIPSKKYTPVSLLGSLKPLNHKRLGGFLFCAVGLVASCAILDRPRVMSDQKKTRDTDLYRQGRTAIFCIYSWFAGQFSGMQAV